MRASEPVFNDVLRGGGGAGLAGTAVYAAPLPHMASLNIEL